MLYAQSVGLARNIVYPLKVSSSQATKSHPGKARSYEPKALNEAMLPMRKKKISPFHTPSTGHHQFPSPLQLKRKNGNVRKKGVPHREQEKRKQIEES